ncbi:hypothetical protein LZ30DRAFT_734658 [Colletotrichum cereale]|nr:hypothetical protein LZ30DRAFT_734658 [Colletotrichum cereale]
MLPRQFGSRTSQPTQKANTACRCSISAVVADLHNFCACGKRYGKTPETDAYWRYDTDATTSACVAYSLRNTGNKQWDSCPDCTMDTYIMNAHEGVPSCFSFGKHMGGDEFDYYCGLKGLQGYCKSLE